MSPGALNRNEWSDPNHPIRVTRGATLPDPMRVERTLAAPQFGPTLLFFSGGTALNAAAQRLVHYTHNSIHLTTPFDSGGSSGKLRKPFDVVAVGDLRSRIMALADRSIRGHAEVFELLSSRLPMDELQERLADRLVRMAHGESEQLARVENPMRDLIANHLGYFLKDMPNDFDLRGASIGNVVLVGGYLNNHRKLDSILFLMSQLVEVRGTVRPIVDDNAHLAATLLDGAVLIGQHRFTGKTEPSITSPIAHLSIVADLDHPSPVEVSITESTSQLIQQADLICFPMGSFYSSIIANLLPAGVASSIGCTDCPRVYVPNTGRDPEQFGMSLADAVRTLLTHLQSDGGETEKVRSGLDFVLLDESDDPYEVEINVDNVRKLGVEVIRTKLVTEESAPHIDPDRFAQALVSLT